MKDELKINKVEYAQLPAVLAYSTGHLTSNGVRRARIQWPADIDFCFAEHDAIIRTGIKDGKELFQRKTHARQSAVVAKHWMRNFSTLIRRSNCIICQPVLIGLQEVFATWQLVSDLIVEIFFAKQFCPSTL